MKAILTAAIFIAGISANADIGSLDKVSGNYVGLDEAGKPCKVSIESYEPQAKELNVSYSSSVYLLTLLPVSDDAERSCQYSTKESGSVLSIRSYEHDETTTFYQLDLQLTGNSANPLSDVSVKSGSNLFDRLACRALKNSKTSISTCSQLRRK